MQKLKSQKASTLLKQASNVLLLSSTTTNGMSSGISRRIGTIPCSGMMKEVCVRRIFGTSCFKQQKGQYGNKTSLMDPNSEIYNLSSSLSASIRLLNQLATQQRAQYHTTNGVFKKKVSVIPSEILNNNILNVVMIVIILIFFNDKMTFRVGY